MAKAMPQSSDALQQMLEECRSYYQHNPSQMAKIDEFERTYRREDAIKWYTQDNFVHRIVNKALRTEDVEALHLFRYFITDLSDGLKAARSELLITRVYRGGILSRDEVEKYQAGYRVETNAFFSCSGDPTVAHSFISLDPHTGTTSSQGRDDEEQFAIFEIDIDPRHASTVTLADISNESLFQQENEILFDMGTTFEIISSDYDDRQHVWRIRMQTSETDPSLYDRYHKYLDERMKETSVHVLFGILLADMGEYGKTLTYFENLLKRLPDDHEDRPNIYYSMSRAYRFLSDHEAALKYLSQAEELQRARLPESNFDYARTLAGIGSVYYELRQYDQELKYYKQAMVIYQQILPDNHLEIARSLNRLGFASFNQHLYSEALDYFDRSLNTYQNLVPDGYPGLAQVIYNLGLVHHALGNSDQTLHFYQEALRQTAKILPDDHLHMALPCYRLGVFHFEQEQLDLALEYAQRALEIRQKKLAPDHALLREAHEMVTQIQSRLTI